MLTNLLTKSIFERKCNAKQTGDSQENSLEDNVNFCDQLKFIKNISMIKRFFTCRKLGSLHQMLLK